MQYSCLSGVSFLWLVLIMSSLEAIFSSFLILIFQSRASSLCYKNLILKLLHFKNTYFTGMLFLKVLNANFLHHCQVGLIISDITCREKILSFKENSRGFFKRAKNKCNNSLTQFYYSLNTMNIACTPIWLIEHHVLKLSNNFPFTADVTFSRISSIKFKSILKEFNGQGFVLRHICLKNYA